MKMKKGMNRKGLSFNFLKSFWFWAIVIAAFLYATVGVKYIHVGLDCNVTAEEFKAYNESSFFSHPIDNTITSLKINLYGCDIEQEGILGRTLAKAKDVLGFNQGFWDFWPDLITGALVGFWFWIVFLLAQIDFWKIGYKSREIAKADYKKLRSSWLGVIGGSFWKIVPIAIMYAIFMQIPIINTIIEVITFKQLLALKGDGFWMGFWNWFIRSFIIAFYVGFLPAAIEAFTRYKLRMRYYEAVVRAKYRGRIADAMGSA